MYLEFKFDFSFVSRLLALDGHLAAVLHGEGAHEDALAVRVRNGQRVVLAARQQRQNSRAVQDGRRRVAVEFGLGQNGGRNAEALLPVRHVEGGHGRVV